MLGLALVPAIAHGGAALITVEADGKNKFSPKVADYIVISGQFYWQWRDSTRKGGTTARKHDVVQDKRLFKSPGGPRKSFPGDFVVSASAGTFPYHCSVHGGAGGQGMSGKIRAIPTYGAGGRTDDQIEVKWADPTNTTGNQYDVRYKPAGGTWKNWKKNTSKEQLVFGKNDKPIDVFPGQTIRFKARSEKAANPSKRSGWSPPFKATADE